MKDLKNILKEFGNPSIEEVHNNLADVLKYLSDNYGETSLTGKSTCMINSKKILETLNALTVATVWLKFNKENFKD